MNVPGVSLKIIDNSDFVNNFSSTACGMLLKSNKGPLSITAVSSASRFIELYGKPDINVSESHYKALQVLNGGNNRLLYCKRVNNNAKYAGCIFYQDKNKNPTKIESIDFPYGTVSDYDNSGFRVILLNLNTFLKRNDKISIDLSNADDDICSVEQNFSETSNNTLQVFAEKLKQQIKEHYNIDIDAKVKKDTSKGIRPEIYEISCENLQKNPDSLECTLSNPIENTEKSITIKISDLSDDIILTSNENDVASILLDYKNQIEANFSSILTANIISENNKIILTATNSDYIFTSYTSENIDVSFGVIHQEFEPSLSFNVPQLNEKIVVTSNYTTLSDVLLDISTKLTTNYSDYLTTVLDSDRNVLVLISKVNYENYFTNLSLKDISGTCNKVQDGFGDNSNRQIIITAPVSSDITYQNYSIINSLNVVNEQEITQNTELFNVFAENPGSWGNDIGISLSVNSMDLGTKESYKLEFNKLVSGVQFNGSFDIYQIDDNYNEISKTRKTYNINSITYFESDEVFLNSIKDELTNLIKENYSDYNGITVDNNNKLIMQSPKSNLLFDLTKMQLIGIPGINNPNLNITKEVYSTVGRNTFSINIYDQNDLSNVLETYNGSLYELKDASNNQINISAIVNTTNPSSYIRIKQFNKSKDSGLEVLFSTGINIMNGGDNGDAVTPSNYIEAMNDFKNDNTLDLLYFIDDGFNDASVKTSLAELAKHCRSLAILNVPKEYTKTIELLKHYRNNVLALDTYSALLLGPAVITYDSYSGNQIELTSSGYYADKGLYTESNYGRHQAVAGYDRGTITGIIGINKNYNDAEFGEIYEPCQINLIRNTGSSFMIDGIKTLQKKATYLQKAPVVLMVNMIDKKLCQALKAFIYELNLPYTRERVADVCNNYLNNLKSNSQIKDFKVICDDSNNSQADIDAGILRVKVAVEFISIVEYVYITLTIEKSGAITSNYS